MTKYISYCDSSYVLHRLNMPHSGSALSLILRTSYGPNLLDHLAADGAGFAGGQVAVVALLQIHADLIGGLHFELVHGLLGLGDAPRLLEELLLLIIILSFSVREASLPEGCDPLAVGVFCPRRCAI